MAITLRAARINAGYTQEMAAKEIGVKSGTIANYENFKTYPPIDKAQDLAALYGLTVNDIQWRE